MSKKYSIDQEIENEIKLVDVCNELSVNNAVLLGSVRQRSGLFYVCRTP